MTRWGYFSTCQVPFTLSITALIISSSIQVTTLLLKFGKKQIIFSMYLKMSDFNVQIYPYLLPTSSSILEYVLSYIKSSIILRYFNLELKINPLVWFLTESCSLINVIKEGFLKINSSWTLQIPSNRNCCFKSKLTLQTGLTDNHYLIYTLLKQTSKSRNYKILWPFHETISVRSRIVYGGIYSNIIAPVLFADSGAISTACRCDVQWMSLTL